jgi:predicted O-linked N-acetylglucosamine transferase (SPINDLY family)
MFRWLSKTAKSQTAPAPDVQEQVKGWMRDGFALFQAGDTRAAESLFHQILHVRPDNADALYLTGLIALGRGEKARARGNFERAISSDAQISAYHISLGQLQLELGEIEHAATRFRSALALDASDADTHGLLGHVLQRLGRPRDALTHFQQALAIQPGNIQAIYNIGAVLQALGQTDEAIGRYKDVLAAQPRHAAASNNLGVLLHAKGAYPAAISHFQVAVASMPEYAQAWSNLGVSLQAVGQLQESENCLQKGVALDPLDASAHSNLALVLRHQGKIKASAQSSEKSLAIRKSLGERMRLATLLPMVAQSSEEIEHWRKRFELELEKIAACGEVLNDPLREVGVCNFNLAYQPHCDRHLQELAAKMYLACCPSLEFTAPHCLQPAKEKARRIRVGFISKFMHRHSIGKTTRGLLANLSRDQFEVIALFVPPMVKDEVSGFICERADRYLTLPPTLSEARKEIASIELDILFYQDIGMDPYTYYLAFSRLAPVQCVSFGHPDTTGIPTMDYWVSNENFETPGAQAHYSEQLVQLHNLGTLAYYYRPQLGEEPKTRQDFGLASERHYYLCPQTLFKLHPDFDSILAAILHGDADGDIILIDDARTPAWGKLLRERLARTVPDGVARIRFIPGMPSEDFLALIACCDVILDTLYFNGMNSSLEAFAVGTPIVTMPTEMQRGRHTFGMYRRMEIMDCVARSPEQYAEIALRLGLDSTFRAEMREKILANCAVLFEEEAVVVEFERFFVRAHQTANRQLAQRIPGKPVKESLAAVFLVSSAIHAEHGVFSDDERLAQTEHTCASIQQKCPGADIVVLDGGCRPLSGEELEILRRYALSVHCFAEFPEFVAIRGLASADKVKNAAELTMFKLFFDRVIAGASDNLSRYARIFKVSGRYGLNDVFDLKVHALAKGKIVIGQPRPSQFDPSTTGGVVQQYMSRLWSFDAALLPAIAHCYEEMLAHFHARLEAGGYIDIEHLLWRHLDHDHVVPVSKLGVDGAVAASGTQISE